MVKMAADNGKKILEEILGKASELSSLLEGNQSSSTSTNQQNTPREPPRFQRQLLPSRSSSTCRGKFYRGPAKKAISGPFLRDVVLLPCPDVTTVPWQGKRVWLMENGFVISAFKLMKEWVECEVEMNLREAFEGKISRDVDIQLFMPVHSSLVKPPVAAGQSLNGIMMHKIFKEKPIYLLPSKALCDDESPFVGEPLKKVPKIDIEDDHLDDGELQQMIEFADSVSATTSTSAPQPTAITSSTSASSISIVEPPSSSSTSNEQPTQSPSTQSVPHPSLLSLPSTSQEGYEEANISNTHSWSMPRVICEKCSCTFPLGEQCIRCIQNEELEASLAKDASPPSEPEEEHYAEPDVVQLRNFRLARLMGVEDDSAVHEHSNHPRYEILSDPPEVLEPTPEVLKVHRISIKADLIKGFKDPGILNRQIGFKIINERGDLEAGMGVGVDREVYTLFWNEFSISMTIGERERVLFVRHDHFIEEWEAIGRILVKGHISVSYFPTFFSKAFICFCLFGKEVTDDLFICSFKRYLSQLEEDLVESVLRNNDLPGEEEEFQDFLERFNCRSHVKKENVIRVLLEIAKQELFQKPHLMVAAWQPILQQGLKPYKQFQSIEAVLEQYETLKPTPKKVLDSLLCSPTTDTEREVFKFLQRFIRGLDTTKVVQFLRFTTAMDVMGGQKLQIAFVRTEGFSSTPVAHTCSPLLEIPSTYNNFVELREEFSNILNRNNWEMNIM